MPDALDFSQVEIYGSPDVHGWPATASITKVEFLPQNFQIEFTKQLGADRWPDVIPPGWDGPIYFTLWPVINVDGHWRTMAAIEHWHDGKHGRYDGVGGPFSKAAQDWYFRVPQMASHQPQAGDQVGFFVTTAVRRNDMNVFTPARERSNVVLVTVPPGDMGVFTFAAEPAHSQPQPPSQPQRPPQSPSTSPSASAAPASPAASSSKSHAIDSGAAAILAKLDELIAVNRQLLDVMKRR